MTSGRFAPPVAWLGIVVELEIAEEGHDETRGGALADGGGIEHGHRQMSVGVRDIVELLHPDGESGAGLRRCCSVSGGQQRRAHGEACRRPSRIGKQEKIPA